MKVRRSRDIDLVDCTEEERAILSHVKLHKDPSSLVTIVFDRSNHELLTLTFGEFLDDGSTFSGKAPQIARRLFGLVCSRCGQRPEEGRRVCERCERIALSDLEEVVRRLSPRGE